MRLYYIPTTRAVRPRWLLEELAVDYDLIIVDLALTRQPEYRKYHPHGKVPVLVDELVTVYESSAICAYLADKYGEKAFAPPVSSPDRGLYYQWMFYAGQTLEPPVEQYMFHVLPNLPEKILPKEYQTHIDLATAQSWFDQVCEPLNTLLSTSPYLLGNDISAADIVTGGVLLWAYKLGMMKRDSVIKTYLMTLMERPAFQRADENHYSPVNS